ncbi:hypothetical protein MA16_Dca026144 [Dendrobium catenatum]|uniref:Uncharacterized protein n=1 Tax=Dendrobium catenatum TaxID=906689 RepID=A0A2I0VDD6_9ASPA|nr:hypothetical protein MA16_Dca026144 [Dendrobium catenatum]
MPSFSDRGSSETAKGQSKRSSKSSSYLLQSYLLLSSLSLSLSPPFSIALYNSSCVGLLLEIDLGLSISCCTFLSRRNRESGGSKGNL